MQALVRLAALPCNLTFPLISCSSKLKCTLIDNLTKVSFRSLTLYYMEVFRMQYEVIEPNSTTSLDNAYNLQTEVNQKQ